LTYHALYIKVFSYRGEGIVLASRER